MRISERKRTTRTPDTSRSASRNTETQRNNQRSLLEGGVGSFHTPASALSVDIAIRSEWGGNNLIIPRGLADQATASDLHGARFETAMAALVKQEAIIQALLR